VTGISWQKLALDSQGNLYAGGEFGTAPGSYYGEPGGVACWDGTNWTTIGSGISVGYDGALALAFDKTGNLYVGGDFTTAGSISSFSIAKVLLNGPLQNQLLLSRSGSQANVLSYLGVPGQNYALDLATNLAAPAVWMPQTTNMASVANAAVAGYLYFTNSSSLPQAFFRMRSVP
jgi:hypothetical protein